MAFRSDSIHPQEIPDYDPCRRRFRIVHVNFLHFNRGILLVAQLLNVGLVHLAGGIVTKREAFWNCQLK